ncbi:hypothetical protein ACFSUK_19725 [Sphingobium scionense]
MAMMARTKVGPAKFMTLNSLLPLAGLGSAEPLDLVREADRAVGDDLFQHLDPFSQFMGDDLLVLVDDIGRQLAVALATLRRA